MRLFVGIAPDDAARDALRASAARLRQTIPGRYVDPALYHLTLAFLGETDAGRLPAVRGALDAVAARTRPCTVRLSGAGRFGGVLWRGVSGAAPLAALAEAVRRALDAAGIRHDAKPFRAHITLARDAGFAACPHFPPLPDAPLSVRALTLFESARTAHGLQYRPVFQSPLDNSF